MAWYDTYHTALHLAVAEALDVFGRCLVMEVGTFVRPPREDGADEDKTVVRIRTTPDEAPEWLIAHWMDALDNDAFQRREMACDAAGAVWASLAEDFGPGLSQLRLELGRHTYLDAEDGFCYTPTHGGPDALHCLLAHAASCMDERCGYPREDLTREQMRSYAVAHRRLDGALPPVRRVVAWKEIENKPRVAMVSARTIHDCWVVLYEQSPRFAPDIHPFRIIDRVTGEPHWGGLRYDEP